MLRLSSSLRNSSSLLNAEKVTTHLFGELVSKSIKRAFDILFALIGLILLLPLFIYISYRIKRDSPGPIFFWGRRAGLSGKPFRILKFRTMYERPESYKGPSVTCKEDDRITPVGRFLRNTKINELPQLWNVLRGDMSFVGPRPEDVEIAEEWPEDARKEILSVRPGITSPASILYHDEEALLSASNVMGEYFRSILPDKMRLDRLYVRNHTFFADLDVIFWTVAILLPQLVKMRIPEGYLFAGPFSRLMNRYLYWFLMDLIVVLGASATAVALWRVQEPLNWGFWNLASLSFLMAMVFGSINSLFGLKGIVWSEAFAEDASGLMISAWIATLITMLANHLQKIYHWLPHPALPITMIFTIGLMASIGFIVVRYRWRLVTGFASRWLDWRSRKGVGERVLIVGSGEGNQLANWLLRHGDASRIFTIVGLVDNNLLAMQGMQVKGLRILGGINDIPALIKRNDVGVVLYAIPNEDLEAQDKILQFCLDANVRMIYLSDLLSNLQRQITQPRSLLPVAGKISVSIE
jgi:lipopolysaccharide/colanic/teichoic acid biosynthesis glycosyltransferase